MGIWKKQRFFSEKKREKGVVKYTGGPNPGGRKKGER